MPEQTSFIDFADFSGGQASAMHPEIGATEASMLPHEAQILENFDVDIVHGLLRKSKGYARSNSAALTGQIRGLFRFITSAGVKILLAAANKPAGNADIWTMNDTTGAFTGLARSLTANLDTFFLGIRGFAAWANGTDNVELYNGTTTKTLGITAPVAGPTVAAGAATWTNLTGSFRYFATFVTADGESDNSPYSAVITVTNKEIDLSAIPTGGGGSGVTQRNIWRERRLGGEFATAVKLYEIKDNTTTTQTDKFLPGANPFNLHWRDKAAPATANYLSESVNRFFLADLRKLYWSAPFEVDTWDSLDYEGMRELDGFNISGLALMPDGGGLLVLKQNMAIIWYGSSNRDWDKILLFPGFGCVAPKTLVATDDGIYWLSRNGLVSFGSTTQPRRVERISTQAGVIGRSVAVRDIIDAIPNNTIAQCAGGWDGKRYYLAYPEVGQTTNSATLVYNPLLDSFAKRTGWAWSCFASLDAPSEAFGNKTARLMAGDYNGFVAKLNETNQNNAASFTSKYRSPVLPLEGRYLTKQPARIHIRGLAGAAQDVTVIVRADYGAVQTTWTWSMTGAAQPELFIKAIPETVRGRVIDVEISQVANATLDIYSISLEYVPRSVKF
mgnify:CR=1 FL=1